MRNIGEQRAERHCSLDAELLRQAEHEPGERLPPQIRLGTEQDHRVTPGARNLRMEKTVLRPLETTRHPILERDLRPHRLEVVELLRLDLRELLRVPLLREVAGGESRALAAVVPPAKRGDEDRPAELRPERH